MDAFSPPPQCPGCATTLARHSTACSECGLPLVGPVAHRLGQVMIAIQRVERDRALLFSQRDALLSELRSTRDAWLAAQARHAAEVASRGPARPAEAPAGPAAPPRPGVIPARMPAAQPNPMPAQTPAAPHPAAAAGSSAAPPARAPRRALRELSHYSVQNLLLLLGGLLIVIAATVFTIVTWSTMGIGGRAAVLGGCTVLAMAAASPLHRRGMTATAETFGALAAALMLLDALALWTVLDFASLAADAGYAAAALAAAASVLAGYTRLVPLQGPRLTALLLAQVVPLLLVVATGLPGIAAATALLVAALGNALLARRLAGGLLRRAARVLTWSTWALGVTIAVTVAVAALVFSPGVGGVWPTASLLLAGAVALLAAPATTGNRTAYVRLASLAWIAAVPALVSALTGSAPFTVASLSVTALAGAAAIAVAALPATVRRGVHDAVRVALWAATPAGLLSVVPALRFLARTASPWTGGPALDALPGAWGFALTVTLAASGLGWTFSLWSAERRWAVPVALGSAGATAAAVAGLLTGAAPAVLLAAAAVLALAAATAAEWIGPSLPRTVAATAAPGRGALSAPSGPARRTAAAEPPGRSAAAPADSPRHRPENGPDAPVTGRSAVIVPAPTVHAPDRGVPGSLAARHGLTALDARRTARTGFALAAGCGVLAAADALVGPVATITVLAVLSAAAAVAAVLTRTDGARAGTAAAAVAAFTGLTTASFLAADAPPAALATGCLAVAAAVVGAASRLARPVRRPGQVAALDAAALIPLLVAAGAAGFAGQSAGLLSAQTGPLALVIAVASLLALVTSTHPAGAPSVPAALRLITGAGKVRVGAPTAAASAAPGARSAPDPAADGPGAEARRALIALSALLGVASLLLVADRLLAAFAVPMSRLTGPFPRSAPATMAADVPPGVLPLFLPVCATALLALVLCVAALRTLPPGSAPQGADGRPRPAAVSPRAAVAAAFSVAAGLFTPVALAHVPVPYGVGLVLLVAASGTLLLLAARSTGGAAYARTATGAVLVLVALAWSLSTLMVAVPVLAALTLLAAGAAAVVRPETARSAPAASGTPAGMAALGAGGTVLAVLMLLVDVRGAAVAGGGSAYPGVVLDLVRGIGPWVTAEWYPFAAVAAAALLAVGARSRLFARRAEQRFFVGGAGLALVLAAHLLALAHPGTLTLTAAVSVIAVALLARVGSDSVGTAVTVLTALPMLVVQFTVAERLLAVVAGPYVWVGRVWNGTGPDGLRTPALATLHGAFDATAGLTAPLACTVATAGLLLVVRDRLPHLLPHVAALVAVPVLAPWLLVLRPDYVAGLGWLLLIAAGLTAAAVLARRTDAAVSAAVAALWAASLAVAWGMAERPATLGVLGVVAVIAAGVPFAARTPQVAAGAAATAVLAAGGFAFALPSALGLPLGVAALAPVAVVAAVAGVVGLRRPDPRVLLAMEAGAGLVGALSLLLGVLAAIGTGALSPTGVALAALGVICLISAPRPERFWLGGVGIALLLAAMWVFLAAMRVADPEPYAAVPAIGALGAGYEWRRRRPDTGSWRAYGAGLALLLVPSTVMIHLVEPVPWRIGLLAVLALAAGLAGARWRLRAPLLMGGAVLLLTATRTGGGPLWDIVVALPNWIPVGVIGILLIVIGARYEQRLRDIKRLGRALRAMQ